MSWIAAHRQAQAAAAVSRSPWTTSTRPEARHEPPRRGWRFASSRRGPPFASRAASPCSTPPRGTASRSTRPAAATARARSAASGSSTGDVPVTALDAHAFREEELAEGWRLACRAQAEADLVRRRAAARHPAEGGDRRRRAPGDPAPVAAEALRRARRADARRISAPISSACATRWTTSSCASRRACCAACRACCASSGFRVTCVVVRRSPHRRRARGHDRASARDRLRPRDDDRRRHAARPRDGYARRGRGRCSTASSRSAPTSSPASRATMLDPDGARAPPRAGRRDDAGARRGGLRAGRRRAGRGVRGRARRQRDDDGSSRSASTPSPSASRRSSWPRGRSPTCPRPSSASPCIPRARATVFPALGAYVGGDVVAGLLATGMTRDRRLRLFIDVGTNCEIALGSADRLVCTAAPAGPAFEAAQIRCGMRAADGAIEVVRIGDDSLELGVIGETEPARHLRLGPRRLRSAELVRVGLLDASGRFVTADQAAGRSRPGSSRRFVEREGGERVFVLHWKGEEGDVENAVYLSQRDVRELQFAKAAIATGWRLLVEELGIDEAEIQQVLLAGSFGSYLSPASAVRIGLVPRLPLPRIVSAGNVAGEGAKMALLSMQERHAADAHARGGRVRRAVRPGRLQRPLHRAARVPGGARDGRRARPRARLRRARARGRSPSSRLNGWTHVDVRCLPAKLHLTPGPDRAGGRRKLRSWTARTSTSSSPTRDCGTNGALDEVLAAHGAERLPGLHCYGFFAGRRRLGGAAGGGAGHVLPDGLPGTSFRGARAAAAQARSLSGAGRRRVRQLPAGRLSRPDGRCRARPSGPAARRRRSASRSSAASPATASCARRSRRSSPVLPRAGSQVNIEPDPRCPYEPSVGAGSHPARPTAAGKRRGLASTTGPHEMRPLLWTRRPPLQTLVTDAPA